MKGNGDGQQGSKKIKKPLDKCWNMWYNKIPAAKAEAHFEN